MATHPTPDAARAAKAFRQALAGTTRSLRRHATEVVLRAACVRIMHAAIRLNRQAGLDERSDRASLSWVVQQGLLAVLLAKRGKRDAASRWLAAVWISSVSDVPIAVERIEESLGPRDAAEEDLVAGYAASAMEVLAEQRRSDRSQHALADLQRHLRLSYDDLGRMLGVSGESARRWSTGAVRTPEDHLAAIDEAHDSLRRLLQMFQPERLPEVVRRPADAFDGKRALDRILEGRIRAVADTYDALLSYQPA